MEITPTNEFAKIIEQVDFARMVPFDEFKRKTYRLPQYVSASGVRNCSRRWYYSLHPDFRGKGTEVRQKAWDEASHHGDEIHRLIQEALVGYGLVDATERYLPRTEHFLSGRIDGLLTARPALLEIKTVAQKYFSEFPRGDKFASYMDQIQVYLEVLNLPEALLVCVRREPIVQGKDFARLRAPLVKEYLVTRDRGRGRELLAKVGRIEEAVRTGTVPDGERGECAFCPYQGPCATEDVRRSLIQIGRR